MTEKTPESTSVPVAISDLYREIATEKTPDSLDESVLAEARRTARKHPAPALPWYRPVVFIGLFGLSLALLIEFSVLSTVEPELGVESQTSTDPGAESILSPKEECTGKEREDAATWWACIQDLEAAGNTAAAEEELRSLLSAYPGFESNAPAER